MFNLFTTGLAIVIVNNFIDGLERRQREQRERLLQAQRQQQLTKIVGVTTTGLGIIQLTLLLSHLHESLREGVTTLASYRSMIREEGESIIRRTQIYGHLFEPGTLAHLDRIGSGFLALAALEHDQSDDITAGLMVMPVEQVLAAYKSIMETFGLSELESPLTDCQWMLGAVSERWHIGATYNDEWAARVGILPKTRTSTPSQVRRSTPETTSEGGPASPTT